MQQAQAAIRFVAFGLLLWLGAVGQVSAGRDLTIAGAQHILTDSSDVSLRQSGIFGSGANLAIGSQSSSNASQGGFDIEVGGTTSLTGGLIDSQASAEHNRLSTARLQTQDIANNSHYSSSTVGGSIGYGSSAGLSATPDMPQSDRGSDRSSTQSAVAPGSITLTQGLPGCGD